jgi:hypothetical protein
LKERSARTPTRGDTFSSVGTRVPPLLTVCSSDGRLVMPPRRSSLGRACLGQGVLEAAVFATMSLAAPKQEQHRVIGSALMIGAVVGLTSLGGDDGIEGDDALSRHFQRNRDGCGSDQRIEMVYAMGSSESVGLVFGYMDDRKACLEAIAGMREANPGRD